MSPATRVFAYLCWPFLLAAVLALGPFGSGVHAESTVQPRSPAIPSLVELPPPGGSAVYAPIIAFGSGPPPAPPLAAGSQLLSSYPHIAREFTDLGGGTTRVTYTIYNNLTNDIAKFTLKFTAAPIYGSVTAAGTSADANLVFSAQQQLNDDAVECIFSINANKVLASGQQAEISCSYTEAASTELITYESMDPAPSPADVDFNQVHDLIDQSAIKDGATLIPVIVLFDQPVVGADRTLFAQHDGSILEELPIIDGFLGQIPANKVHGYRAAAPVAFIDASLAAQPELNIATRNTRADRAWLGDTDGYANPISETLHLVDGENKSSIAIVDSGLDDGHPSISGFQDVRTLAGGWGSVSASTKIVGWYNWSGSATISDSDGHGSHVGGIAAGDGGGVAGGLDLRGVAHDARLVGVRVPTMATTNFFTRNVISALGWLRPFLDDYHVVAVNQSLGLSTASPAWNRATRAIVQAGVVALKSAGNSFHRMAAGASSITTPGPEPKLLTVGAVNDTDRVAYFSSNGLAGVAPIKPDVVAPGKVIRSVDSNDKAPGDGTANNYKDEDGTSMASPHVAGEVALIVDAMTDYDADNADGEAGNAEDDWDGIDDDKDDIIDEDPGEWPYTENAALMVKSLVLMSTAEVPGGECVPQVLWYDEDNDGTRNAGDELYWDRNCNGVLDAGETVGANLGANTVMDAALGDNFSNTDGDARRGNYPRPGWPRSGNFNAPGDNGAGPGTAGDGVTDTFHRGGKDPTEGYGRVSIDAAVEAVTREFCAFEKDTLGPAPSDKKVWARHLHLYKDKEYKVRMEVPAGADYDVYLYQEIHAGMSNAARRGATGDPAIAKRPDNTEIKSTTAITGSVEEMTFQVQRDGLYFLVVRRVSGAGEFTIRLITPEEWTVMVYMPAELLPTATMTQGLDSLAIAAINDMEKTGSGEESMKEFQVLALVDYDEHAWDGKEGEDGDPDHRGDAVLYCIRKDHKSDEHQYSIVKQPADVLEVIDENKPTQRAEVNMGDPETVKKFVTWAIDHFPAKKYALVMWGDGNGYGWKVNPGKALGPGNDTKRVVSDTQDIKMDAIEMHELRTAMQKVKVKINAGSQYKSGTGVNRNLDVLGFDMGHMALIEVAQQVQDSVDVMVASEERIHKDGWDYEEFLAGLLCVRQGGGWNCPAPTIKEADELGMHAVSVYGAYYSTAPHVDPLHTLSAVRLNPKPGDTFINPCEWFAAMVGCVDSLAIVLKSGVDDVLAPDNPADNVQIKIKHEAREMTEEMQDKNYIDLRHFALKVDTSTIPDNYKKPHAIDIYNALGLSGKIVLANEHGSGHPNAQGLTIYYPHDQLAPETDCKESPDRDKDRECGFDSPMPSHELYAKDAEILAPILGTQEVSSTVHPRVQIPGFRFPQENKWDEFLHRYYKPVADACIRYGGGCLKSVVIFVGETVTLSGAGSSDSDGPDKDDLPQHWYWDLFPLVDTGGAKPTYPLTSTAVIDDPCTEDCDRDDMDETDDDKNADAQTVDWLCEEPGPYSFRLMTHDEHNNQAAQHGEQTHYVHWKLDTDSVSLVCIAGKISTPITDIPETPVRYKYAVSIPSQPGLAGSTSASFSDPLPPIVEYVDGSCTAGCSYDSGTHTVNWTGEVAQDSHTTVEFDVFIPTVSLPIEWPPIENTVELDYGVHTYSATDTLQCVPFKRTSSPTVPVGAGEVYSYTITVPAPEDIEGPVSAAVTDTLQPPIQYVNSSLQCNTGICQHNSGTIHWNGMLNQGEQLVMTFEVQVAPTLPSECEPQIHNTAEVNDGSTTRTVHSLTGLTCP